MLRADFIKANKDLVVERLGIKNFKQTEIVNEIIALDDKRKQQQALFDNTQSQINAASREIGALMAKGAKEEAENKKAEVANLKALLEPAKQEMESIEAQLTEKLLLLPNLPGADVPPGKTPEDNVVVRSGGNEPVLHANAVPHWDLAKKYNLIDFDLGNKVTGAGFPFYIGKGAKLQRALIQYFLDFNTNADYTEIQPPLMVNEDSLYATGQLPDKEGQQYHMQVDNFYMIPTAEVPVTNVYRDTILKETDLPIKMTAYSACFRREAGSYGKDVRGLNRLHQFDKVEIVQLTNAENSYAVLDEMVDHVEALVQSLELPYRILKLCGGDMSFASALTYDFEVYSAAQQRWLEVSSVSNFENYQTNRMKCRYKNAEGKTVLAHSLNGSSLALPRIVAALLENNQTQNGIKLPAVLHKYFGSDVLI